MSEKIEPALLADEWAHASDPDVRESLAYEVCYLWGESRPAGAIAIANDALPDDDPRKISREWIATLRDWSNHFRILEDAYRNDPNAVLALSDARKGRADFTRFADALESYLPPESSI